MDLEVAFSSPEYAARPHGRRGFPVPTPHSGRRAYVAGPWQLVEAPKQFLL